MLKFRLSDSFFSSIKRIAQTRVQIQTLFIKNFRSLPPLYGSKLTPPAGFINYKFFNVQLLKTRLAHRRQFFENLFWVPKFKHYFIFLVLLVFFLVEYGAWDFFYLLSAFTYLMGVAFALDFLNIVEIIFNWTGALFGEFFKVAASVVYFCTYAWETWIDIAASKYLVERPLFELVLNLWHHSPFVLIVSWVFFLEFFILIMLIKFFEKISDHWEFLFRLSQARDGDFFLKTANHALQTAAIDLYDLKRTPSKLSKFLYFYKLGYISHEISYYNTLHGLLASSRLTLFGYRGFLNLFPSALVILNPLRFKKKKILQNMRATITTRLYSHLQLSKNSLYSQYIIAPEIINSKYASNLLLSKNFYSRFSYLMTLPKTWFMSLIESLAGRSSQFLLGDSAAIKKTLKTFSYQNWYLSFSENEGDRLVPKHSFQSEDNVFNWYRRELELAILTPNFHNVFRRKQLFNFQFGNVNILGDSTFKTIEANYHGIMEHDFPDEKAPFFESEDVINNNDKKYQMFDSVGGEDEEEFIEEDDIEYPNELHFEDGFLHSDIEIWGGSEEEDFDELMLDDGILSKQIHTRAAEFKEFDLEVDETREDMLDILMSSRWGFRNYNTITDSEQYRGTAELEFGNALTYREQVYDTLYDDLADFFWLNSFERGLNSWFVFSKNRLFTAENTSKIIKNARKFRLIWGRSLYALPFFANQLFFWKNNYFIWIFVYSLFFVFSLSLTFFVADLFLPHWIVLFCILVITFFLLSSFYFIQKNSLRYLVLTFYSFANKLNNIFFLIYIFSFFKCTKKGRNEIACTRKISSLGGLNKINLSFAEFRLTLSVSRQVELWLRESFVYSLVTSTYMYRDLNVSLNGERQIHNNVMAEVFENSLISSLFKSPDSLTRCFTSSRTVKTGYVNVFTYKTGLAGGLIPGFTSWVSLLYKSNNIFKPQLNCVSLTNKQSTDNLFLRLYFANLEQRSLFVNKGAVEIKPLRHLHFKEPSNSKHFLRPKQTDIKQKYLHLEPAVLKINKIFSAWTGLSQLFLSQDLLDRVYHDQVGSGRLRRPVESFFYAQVSGSKVNLNFFDSNFVKLRHWKF